jgi:hypothetical protein
MHAKVNISSKIIFKKIFPFISANVVDPEFFSHCIISSVQFLSPCIKMLTKLEGSSVKCCREIKCRRNKKFRDQVLQGSKEEGTSVAGIKSSGIKCKSTVCLPFLVCFEVETNQRKEFSLQITEPEHIFERLV